MLERRPAASRSRPSRLRCPAASPAARWRRLRRRTRQASEELPAIDFTEAADIPVRTPPIVLGEENKVRQVVTNLLGNARRFSPEDGPIELVVDADRVRGTGSIAIVDHGEGIPPQIREQIFERFWRADTSRARETGGSGLGLAIVASIVKALHGSVRRRRRPLAAARPSPSRCLSPPRARRRRTCSRTRSRSSAWTSDRSARDPAQRGCADAARRSGCRRPGSAVPRLLRA